MLLLCHRPQQLQVHRRHQLLLLLRHRLLPSSSSVATTAAERDTPLKRRFEDGVASTELSNYLCLHHRDLNFTKTVEKARIFHSTMEGSKTKKAVRFLNDTTCQQVMASAQDLLQVINHLKSIEGRLDKMVKPAKPQIQPLLSSNTSAPTSMPPPLPTPRLPQQQQQWRTRGPPPNPQPVNTGQCFGPRQTAFVPPAPTTRVRTILVLGYWVLGNIHRYWVVSLLGDIFCCSDTQYNTNQTAASTIHIPVNDYLVPLVTCTLTDAIICWTPCWYAAIY